MVHSGRLRPTRNKLFILSDQFVSYEENDVNTAPGSYKRGLYYNIISVL
jgi:hypothetical protein